MSQQPDCWCLVLFQPPDIIPEAVFLLYVNHSSICMLMVVFVLQLISSREGWGGGGRGAQSGLQEAEQGGSSGNFWPHVPDWVEGSSSTGVSGVLLGFHGRESGERLGCEVLNGTAGRGAASPVEEHPHGDTWVASPEDKEAAPAPLMGFGLASAALEISSLPPCFPSFLKALGC